MKLLIGPQKCLFVYLHIQWIGDVCMKCAKQISKSVTVIYLPEIILLVRKDVLHLN